MAVQTNSGSPSQWWITGQGEVVAVRVRYGWFGRPIVQIRRAQYRSQGAWPRPDRYWEVDTDGAFVDATKHDLPDIKIYLERPLKDYTLAAAPSRT